MHSQSTVHRHSNENDFVWWLISKVLTCHVRKYFHIERKGGRKKVQPRRTATYVALNSPHHRMRPNLICGRQKKMKTKQKPQLHTMVEAVGLYKHKELRLFRAREANTIPQTATDTSSPLFSLLLVNREWKHGIRQNNSRFGNMKCN